MVNLNFQEAHEISTFEGYADMARNIDPSDESAIEEIVRAMFNDKNIGVISDGMHKYLCMLLAGVVDAYQREKFIG